MSKKRPAKTPSKKAAKSTSKAKSSPKKPEKSQPRIARKLMLFGLKTSIWGVLIATSLLIWMYVTLPDPLRAIEAEHRQASITLLDRHGSMISRSKGYASEPITFATMPALLPEAFIQIEDRQFYDHWGVDPFGIARAMWANLRAGRIVQGGSTITQQVAKNLFLTPNRTLWRKLQEAMLAIWLESHFSKQQILEIYANRIYLGSGIYGVGAAARQYFDKSVEALNIAEIAILAGLPKAPSRYSPLAHPHRAAERAQTVLRVLHEREQIDQAEYAKARQRLTLGNLPIRRVSGQYFDLWLRAEIDQLELATQDMVIHTTLDLPLQTTIENQVNLLLPEMAKQNIEQVSVITLDKQGAVRAMIGGVDWKKSNFNRATQARRQVGSVFKLMVYAAALENGFHPETEVTLPANNPAGEEHWWPEDSSQQSADKMRLQEGMRLSSNIMAVTLTEHIGRGHILRMARRLGISSDLPNLPSVALGVGEIPLMEMTNAYTTIANGGLIATPFGIDKITSLNGALLYQHEQQMHRVFSEAVAADLDRMLQEVVNTGTGRQAKSQSLIGGKTGTTNNHRDALFIGYGQDLTTGIWMGNDRGQPMKGTTGGSLPAQLSFMISRIFPH